MESISLKNFRCFRNEQKARLAPLTLLVGDNSTGKTSFMAMVRALWQAAYGHKVPDFKEAPYDLGSFDDIAHYRGRRGGHAETFEAAFEVKFREGRSRRSSRVSVVFGKNGAAPVPLLRRFESGDCWTEECLTENELREIRAGNARGSWRSEFNDETHVLDLAELEMWVPLVLLFSNLFDDRKGSDTNLVPFNNSPHMTDNDRCELGEAQRSLRHCFFSGRSQALYASAPVRSQPRRTYDPSRVVSDPEGDYIPMYLANMYFQDKQAWASLKQALETFGKTSGLFGEIEIKQLGKRESEPFQIRIRKVSGRLKGPLRNMKDVGYGVSQVLPVITELLRCGTSSSTRSAPSIFLLQQPEVHLHPTAQAALGSFFCEIAGPGRQLIVETHSDHLLDRVRMDVRDGKGKLAPRDVSILYFDRDELDVSIHSLGLDREGNVQGAPEGYRAFFMEETLRSLGL